MSYVAELFAHANVVDKKGQNINLVSHCAGKTVGIYFSAHWCPPCRGFTPILAEFYNKHKESKNFEIIFVSSDKDQNQFDEYYSEMPWLALQFKYRNIKKELAHQFGVHGIPCFILINGDSGNIYSNNARSYIEFNDREGEKFPWNQ